jgi:hypothetical protein
MTTWTPQLCNLCHAFGTPALKRLASNEGFINGDVALQFALQQELDDLYWRRANALERFSLHSLIEYVNKN